MARGGGGGRGVTAEGGLFFTVCDSIQTQQQEWILMKLLLMALLDRWLV